MGMFSHICVVNINIDICSELQDPIFNCLKHLSTTFFTHYLQENVIVLHRMRWD